MTILSSDEIRLFADPPSTYSDLARTALAALSVAKRLMEGWTDHDGRWVRAWWLDDPWTIEERTVGEPMSDDEAAVLALLRTEEP